MSKSVEVIPPNNHDGKKKGYETKSLSLDKFSPEVIQAIYHEITNKREKIQDFYQDNVEIKRENLKELDWFICQTLKPIVWSDPMSRLA